MIRPANILGNLNEVALNRHTFGSPHLIYEVVEHLSVHRGMDKVFHLRPYRSVSDLLGLIGQIFRYGTVRALQLRPDMITSSWTLPRNMARLVQPTKWIAGRTANAPCTNLTVADSESGLQDITPNHGSPFFHDRLEVHLSGGYLTRDDL